MSHRILIVDDEPDLTGMLKDYLGGEGFSVLTAHTAEEALALLAREKTELILSDIKMPGKTGVELFQEFKQKHDAENKIPFVLMTAHADLLSVQNAFKIGVNELIAKPFDFEAVRLVIDYLLDSGGAYGDEADSYFSVPIEEFILSSSSQYSIFLRLADRYVRVTKSGQEFTAQRLENFAKKGATHIYLNSADFAKYTDMQFAISTTITKRPLEEVKRIRIMNQLMSSVSQNSIARQLDGKFLNQSLQAFESYTNMALQNPRLNSVMGSLAGDFPSLAEISTLRAVISCSVASLWRWTSPKIQSRIILAALLCDVGLKDAKGLLQKKRVEYTPDELRQYEQHPLTSYEMLKQIENIPNEILFVAIQHHENATGLGFPQKLARSKTHAYSKIVHGAEMLIEALMEQPDRGNIQQALDRIYAVQGKVISEQVLKSLYILFGAEPPRALSALLLPTETTRVV